MKLFKRLFRKHSMEIPELEPVKDWLQGMTPERIRETYRTVFSSMNGRVVLADLEAKYGNRSTVQKERGMPIDPNDVLVREGERRVLLRIKHMLKEA